MQDAVRLVAEAHDLAPSWVNHHAAGFMPQTLDLGECERLIDHPRLLVLGAPVRQVSLMKLLAGREIDHDDLVALWPLSDASAEQIVDEFWQAYPAAPDDDYLISWIEDIAAEARAGTS